MIASRARFYVVAGIAGAIVGELLAAGGAAVLSQLAPATAELHGAAALLYSGALIVLGFALGAWGAVALLRRWFWSIDAAAADASLSLRARARSRTPRPIRRPCTPVPDACGRVERCSARRALSAGSATPR